MLSVSRIELPPRRTDSLFAKRTLEVPGDKMSFREATAQPAEPLEVIFHLVRVFRQMFASDVPPGHAVNAAGHRAAVIPERRQSDAHDARTLQALR